MRASRGFVARSSFKASASVAVLFLIASGAVAPYMAFGLQASHARADVTVSSSAEEPPALLVFACDGPLDKLERLLQPNVIADLRDLKAGIALALPDLSSERAQLVAMLNKAGIPVIAWLALSPEQGYYINAGNAPETGQRFDDFERWTSGNHLRWSAIGLDIEPNVQEFSAFKQGSKWRIATTLIGRYFDEGRVRRARESYGALIRKMQTRGYSVQTYQFPFMADERRVHSTVLERLFGIVDVRGDQEALMVYTAFNHRLGSGLVWAYGPDAQEIVVGLTIGSDDAPQFVPLDWQAFSRDLIVAHHFSRSIGVYNLEGCVRQGFLRQLKTFDWSQSVVIPAESVRGAEQFRARVQRVIWIVSRLPYFAALFVGLIVLGIAWRRRRARRLAPQAEG